jgi:hypothetical protein
MGHESKAALVADLAAALRAARPERDAAYAVIRRYRDGWKAQRRHEDSPELWWWKDIGALGFVADKWAEMTPAEADAIAQATRDDQP